MKSSFKPVLLKKRLPFKGSLFNYYLSANTYHACLINFIVAVLFPCVAWTK